MAKRGPKSAADLAVQRITGTVEVKARPDADYSLPDEAADVWKATVEALPADWIGAEALPILSAYCRSTVQLRRLGQLIHQMETTPGELEHAPYLALLKAHSQVAQTAKTLATSLRLTPQTRLRAETAARQVDGFKPGPKPWEDR